MALTAHQLTLRLVKHLGSNSIDPDDPAGSTLFPGDIDYALSSINAALAEIWEMAPTAIRHRRLNAAIHAPEEVSLTLTHGSRAMTFPGYLPWMEGCTLRAAGWDNELVDAHTLLYPHSGETEPGGSLLNAVVYHDCVLPPAGVSSLVDPVVYTEGHEALALERLLNRDEFERWRGRHGRQTDRPRWCFVETRYLPDQSRLGVRLRLYPLPARAGRLAYGSRQDPPSITLNDIGTVSDPAVRFPLPTGWDEVVLLPLALARFATHPFFSPTNLRLEFQRQAEVARRVVHQSRPDRASGSLIPTFR